MHHSRRKSGAEAVANLASVDAIFLFFAAAMAAVYGSLTRVPHYRCTRTMHFSNAVCTVKHINADHLERLVVGKLSEPSQNEAKLGELVCTERARCPRWQNY
jgi:hypothetical protein